MSQIDRFQDALEELAKARTAGYEGNHFAYMSGYLIGLIGEMARNSDEARRLLDRSLKDTEEMLFVANKMTEVDSIA